MVKRTLTENLRVLSEVSDGGDRRLLLDAVDRIDELDQETTDLVGALDQLKDDLASVIAGKAQLESTNARLVAALERLADAATPLLFTGPPHEMTEFQDAITAADKALAAGGEKADIP
jgi:phage shock protein A